MYCGCNSMHSQQLPSAEMVKTASELRMKMHNLKTKRMNDMMCIKAEELNNADRDFCSMNRGKGNSSHVYVIFLIELIILYGEKSHLCFMRYCYFVVQASTMQIWKTSKTV